jgi:hypothetical protein
LSTPFLAGRRGIFAGAATAAARGFGLSGGFGGRAAESAARLKPVLDVGPDPDKPRPVHDRLWQSDQKRVLRLVCAMLKYRVARNA